MCSSQSLMMWMFLLFFFFFLFSWCDRNRLGYELLKFMYGFAYVSAARIREEFWSLISAEFKECFETVLCSFSSPEEAFRLTQI